MEDLWKQARIVQIKVLTVNKNVLCQIPYESGISKEQYDKAEFLGKIYVDTYNKKCRGSMRTGTAHMMLVRVPDKVDKVFLMPMSSHFAERDPKTKDILELYVE